jgi:hypothetical protein
LFISSESEIHAIDLLTHDTSVVIRRLKNSEAMAIDMKNEKLYFEDNNTISSANLDGTGVEVIIKKADVWNMAIDWIGRRIFWTQYNPDGIFVANLNGKERRLLIKTSPYLPDAIAVDPIVGYVFFYWNNVRRKSCLFFNDYMQYLKIFFADVLRQNISRPLLLLPVNAKHYLKQLKIHKVILVESSSFLTLSFWSFFLGKTDKFLKQSTNQKIYSVKL